MSQVPFIIVKSLHGKSVAEGSEAKVQVGLFLGDHAAVASGDTVWLVVYDLDQYLASQQAAAEANGTSGEHEVDAQYFTKETNIGFELMAHEVRAGSGVLFSAALTLHKPDEPRAQPWSVEPPGNGERFENKTLGLQLIVETGVNVGGTTQRQAIGVAGPAASDLQAFLESGQTERQLVFRLLSEDMRTVLLSSANPDLSTAGSMILCRYLKPTNSKAPEVQDFGDRRMAIDLTGTYEECTPSDDRRRLAENDPEVRSPSVLHLQQAGLAIVGWYDPVPNKWLDDPEVITEGSKSEMWSSSSLVILGTWLNFAKLTDTIALSMKDEEAVIQVGPVTEERKDPPGIFQHLGGTQAYVLSVTSLSTDELLTIREKTASGADGQVWQFRKSSSNSRVPNQVTQEFLSSANFQQFHDELKLKLESAAQASLPGAATPSADAIRDALLRASRQATPPGVFQRICRCLISPEIRELLCDWIDARNSAQNAHGDTSGLRVVERQINQHLVAATTNFDPADYALGLLVSRRNAEERSFYHAAANHGYWETLTTIVETILQRMAGVGHSDQYNELYNSRFSEAEYCGFALWSIGAPQRYEYGLEFTELSASTGALIKGTLGGFSLTVSGTDTQSGEPLDEFTPAPTYLGAFIGGGIGLGYSVSFFKRGGDAASGGPVSCTLLTHLRLRPADFEWAVFNTLALAKPSVNVSAGPVGLASNWAESVFSITLFHRTPKAVLDVVIDQANPIEVSAEPNSIKDYLLAWWEAISSGDVAEVPLPSVSGHLASITGTYGIILPGDHTSDGWTAPEPQTWTSNIHELPFHYHLQSDSFESGSAVLQPRAVWLLDHSSAMYRKLLENGAQLHFSGTTSPEWGRLSESAASANNMGLSRRRAEAVHRALLASLGGVGGGIIPAGLGVSVHGYGSSLYRLTDDPGSQEDSIPLDPYCDAAQGARAEDPELKGDHTTIQRIRRDRDKLYPHMRVVLVDIQGVLVLAIPSAKMPH